MTRRVLWSLLLVGRSGHVWVLPCASYGDAASIASAWLAGDCGSVEFMPPPARKSTLKTDRAAS